MSERAVHRPISMRLERISRLPVVRDLPLKTEMTINLSMDQKMAKELVLFLLKEILVDEPQPIITFTATGIS